MPIKLSVVPTVIPTKGADASPTMQPIKGDTLGPTQDTPTAVPIKGADTSDTPTTQPVKGVDADNAVNDGNTYIPLYNAIYRCIPLYTSIYLYNPL